MMQMGFLKCLGSTICSRFADEKVFVFALNGSKYEQQSVELVTLITRWWWVHAMQVSIWSKMLMSWRKLYMVGMETAPKSYDSSAHGAMDCSAIVVQTP